MAEGRRRDAWNLTSHVLAWIQNFGFRKAPLVQARDLNPMAPKEKLITMPLKFLKEQFLNKPPS